MQIVHFQTSPSPPPLILGKKKVKVTEGRKAGRASRTKPKEK